MKARLAITLDTECDKGAGWRVQKPLSFRNVVEGVPERIEPLLRRHGVHATYLLSPEVLRDDACAELFAGLNGGTELGTHLHAEFIEPRAQMDTDRTVTFQGELPPRVEFEKLLNLTALFVRRFGRAPTSFRAGRYGLGRHTLRFLEELGYLVDSSVTPHTWWRGASGGVSYLGAPDQPYHPSDDDVRRQGAMRIVEAPITLVDPAWDLVPSGLRRRINPFRFSHGLVLKACRGRRKPTWLRPSFANATAMLAATDYLARRAQGDLFLCVMFHTNEATAGAGPYNATDADVAKFLGELDAYLDALRARYDVEPIGLSEAAAAACPA
jgi:hypothetical protein